VNLRGRDRGWSNKKVVFLNTCVTLQKLIVARWLEGNENIQWTKQTKELPVVTIIIIKMLCTWSPNWKAFVIDNTEIEPIVSILHKGSVRSESFSQVRELHSVLWFLVKIIPQTLLCIFKQWNRAGGAGRLDINACYNQNRVYSSLYYVPSNSTSTFCFN